MVTQYPLKAFIINRVLEICFWLLSTIIKFFNKIVPYENSAMNILLIEPFQLGDVISLSTVFRPLKDKYPDCNIYILTKTSNAHLFENDYRVAGVLTAEFPWSDHGAKRYGTIQRWKNLLVQLNKIRRIDFKFGIDTRGDIRSQFILKFLHCEKVIGYTRNNGSNLTNLGLLLNIPIIPNNNYLHRYEWNIYTLTALGFDVAQLFPIQFPSIITKSNLNNNYILIHVGSGWEYKRWNQKNWVMLINYILETYNQEVHLIAGNNEKEVLEELILELGVKKKLYTRITTYKELVEEISNCTIFIGLDSGPMHIADCLNKSVLALFGPGNSELWRPYSNGSHYIHNINSFKCNPCFQKECLHPFNNCMDAIKIEEVKLILRMFKL